MEGRQGIFIAAGLVALVGIGIALIMAIGVPQSNPTAASVPGGLPPAGNPNDIGSFPSETGTAGDTTTGNATGNQSQTGTTSSGGAAGGLYGGP